MKTFRECLQLPALGPCSQSADDKSRGVARGSLRGVMNRMPSPVQELRARTLSLRAVIGEEPHMLAGRGLQ